MDKVESEAKYNQILQNDNWATEIIRDYMKSNKRLWITNIVFGVIILIIISIGAYFVLNYDITTSVTTETVHAGGNFTQYNDNAKHEEVSSSASDIQ